MPAHAEPRDLENTLGREAEYALQKPAGRLRDSSRMSDAALEVDMASNARR